MRREAFKFWELVRLILENLWYLSMLGYKLIHANKLGTSVLTQRGRVTHICVIKLTIIGSYNGLSPGRHQAIIWTNAGKLLIGPLGTTSMKFYSEFKLFHSRKCIWKCSLENGIHFVSASMCWYDPNLLISVFANVLVALGHQQAQCWLQSYIFFLQNSKPHFLTRSCYSKWALKSHKIMQHFEC